MKNRHQNGFSLVELSIVLVIIGLLVGGTLAGQEVLKGAKLKSLISDVNKTKGAVEQFTQMYSGLPGDIANATSYWPAETVDGDRDGTIDAETSNEPFAALRQLSLSKLVTKTSTGTWGSGFVAGSSGNVFDTGFDGAYLYVKCCSGTDYARSISFNNHISIFGVYAANNDFRQGIMTPMDAYSIDKKMDDGIPDNGFVGSSGSYTGAAYAATGCYSGTGATSTYDSSGASKNLPNCQMQFAYDWE